MEKETLHRDTDQNPFPFKIPSYETQESLRLRVQKSIQLGTEYLLTAQREEGFWCAEQESNPTISSEYIFMCQMLGIDLHMKKDALVKYFLHKQNSDGSWGVADHWKGDVSTTSEVYLALRILGIDQENSKLKIAEHYIKSQGGLEKIRVFTRIFFAMFGLVSWESVPVIPAEFVFFPSQIPVNIFYLASWGRSELIPLLIIFHHQPTYALPNGQVRENPWLDHLWLEPDSKKDAFKTSLTELFTQNKMSWKSFFGLTEPLVRFFNQNYQEIIREKALHECTQWVLNRQESSGDLGGNFPSMMNGVIALILQGYSLDSEPIKKGLQAIEKLAWEDSKGLRVQACVSPVRDTALSVISLVDSSIHLYDPPLAKAMSWILNRQLLVDQGDWKVNFNSWYPDIDGTALVIIAFLKQDPMCAYRDTLLRAVKWILGMQNSDGGWASFDVTGRVLEAFGLLFETLQDHDEQFSAEGKDAPEFSLQLQKEIKKSITNGIKYLRKNQEKDGSWFGRWGVNYIYGTSTALCGLARVGVMGSDPMVSKALAWLRQVQKTDGSWGESVESYSDRIWRGKGESTPSQTAWAIMGLLNYYLPTDSHVERGVTWLADQQSASSQDRSYEGGKIVPTPMGATWEEKSYTGTGFPHYFYLRNNYYRHYFPMTALGRYLKAFAN